MGKNRTFTVNYRKKTGKVEHRHSFLDTTTSTKPDKGTPIEIGESILECIAKYSASPMNSFDMSFGAKFEKQLQDFKNKKK
jgi:hypothetical protein